MPHPNQQEPSIGDLLSALGSAPGILSHIVDIIIILKPVVETLINDVEPIILAKIDAVQKVVPKEGSELIDLYKALYFEGKKHVLEFFNIRWSLGLLSFIKDCALNEEKFKEIEKLHEKIQQLEKNNKQKNAIPALPEEVQESTQANFETQMVNIAFDLVEYFFNLLGQYQPSGKRAQTLPFDALDTHVKALIELVFDKWGHLMSKKEIEKAYNIVKDVKETRGKIKPKESETAEEKNAREQAETKEQIQVIKEGISAQKYYRLGFPYLRTAFAETIDDVYSSAEIKKRLDKHKRAKQEVGDAISDIYDPLNALLEDLKKKDYNQYTTKSETLQAVRTDIDTLSQVIATEIPNAIVSLQQLQEKHQSQPDTIIVTKRIKTRDDKTGFKNVTGYEIEREEIKRYINSHITRCIANLNQLKSHYQQQTVQLQQLEKTYAVEAIVEQFQDEKIKPILDALPEIAQAVEPIGHLDQVAEEELESKKTAIKQQVTLREQLTASFQTASQTVTHLTSSEMKHDPLDESQQTHLADSIQRVKTTAMQGIHSQIKILQAHKAELNAHLQCVETELVKRSCNIEAIIESINNTNDAIQAENQNKQALTNSIQALEKDITSLEKQKVEYRQKLVSDLNQQQKQTENEIQALSSKIIELNAQQSLLLDAQAIIVKSTHGIPFKELEAEKISYIDLIQTLELSQLEWEKHREEELEAESSLLKGWMRSKDKAIEYQQTLLKSLPGKLNHIEIQVNALSPVFPNRGKHLNAIEQELANIDNKKELVNFESQLQEKRAIIEEKQKEVAVIDKNIDQLAPALVNLRIQYDLLTQLKNMAESNDQLTTAVNTRQQAIDQAQKERKLTTVSCSDLFTQIQTLEKQIAEFETAISENTLEVTNKAKIANNGQQIKANVAVQKRLVQELEFRKRLKLLELRLALVMSQANIDWSKLDPNKFIQDDIYADYRVQVDKQPLLEAIQQEMAADLSTITHELTAQPFDLSGEIQAVDGKIKEFSKQISTNQSDLKIKEIGMSLHYLLADIQHHSNNLENCNANTLQNALDHCLAYYDLHAVDQDNLTELLKKIKPSDKPSEKGKLTEQINQINQALAVFGEKLHARHQRLTVAKYYQANLHQYLAYRNNKYRFKDFVTNKDKVKRETFIRELNQLLLTYSQSGNTEVVQAKIAAGLLAFKPGFRSNKKHPDKSLSGILKQLQQDLAESASEITAELTKSTINPLVP